MQKKINPKYSLILIYCLICSAFALPAWGQMEDDVSQVEINGDEVSYSMEENKVYATGNVVIVRGAMTLTADKVVFDRTNQVAVAEGNVIITRPGQGAIAGDQITFNFGSMTGDFEGANIAFPPFYGKGILSKEGENLIAMKDGYITTSDYDEPEWRLSSKRIEMYPGDKVVARGIKLKVQKLPIMYIPIFKQNIKDDRPRFHFTPGYDKDWGAFLLTQWRYYFSEDFKGTLHLDYRQRLGLGEGVDLDYDMHQFGKGIIRTYYTHERKTDSHSFFEEPTGPTIEKERFKAEWRHKWQIDDKTNAIWQYYKVSDSTFLKDYFENEHETDENPNSFALITRAVPKGTLSFRTDVRVNRFESKLERLPEVRLDVPNAELFDTGAYLKSIVTYSNLVRKTAAPSDDRDKTHRLNLDNELSYPFKLSIFELRPFVGGQNTFYSRTPSGTEDGIMRGAFRTGASLSTKFYRIFDVDTDAFKLNINRLRHIVTPSVAYLYKHDPPLPDSQIDQYDEVDTITRSHYLTFSLENKLQTKRNEKSVDLVRAVLSTDFKLKEDIGSGGFNTISADIDVHPRDGISFYFDSAYDTQRERLTTANFDIYINGKGWYFDLGKRYNVGSDDQITTEFGWKINPKWKFKAYQRFDIQTGSFKETDFIATRDLHSWEMDFNFNHKINEGEEILVAFRLKAFPEMGFDFGKSFNRRRSGSNN